MPEPWRCLPRSHVSRSQGWKANPGTPVWFNHEAPCLLWISRGFLGSEMNLPSNCIFCHIFEVPLGQLIEDVRHRRESPGHLPGDRVSLDTSSWAPRPLNAAVSAALGIASWFPRGRFLPSRLPVGFLRRCVPLAVSGLRPPRALEAASAFLACSAEKGGLVSRDVPLAQATELWPES